MNTDNNSSPCLGYLSCFNALSKQELDFINSKTRHLFFQRGETICKQGVYAPYVIFLTRGLVKVYLEVHRDKHISTHLTKSGDFISFSSVFDENAYKISATALTDSDVCMIDREAVIKLIKENGDFSYRIISRNCLIENRLLSIISNLSYKQMAGKLATTILYLNDFGFENIFKSLSRKEIAEFANISIESTVKLLKDFETRKILTLEGKNITINNRETLQEISIKG